MASIIVIILMFKMVTYITTFLNKKQCDYQLDENTSKLSNISYLYVVGLLLSQGKKVCKLTKLIQALNQSIFMWSKHEFKVDSAYQKSLQSDFWLDFGV